MIDNPLKGVTVPSSGGLVNVNSTDLGHIISAIVPFVFYGAGIALLIYLVFGGIQLMMSRGDPKAIQGAQAKITNALIGFIIVLLAYAVVAVLGKVLRIEMFSQIFG